MLIFSALKENIFKKPGFLKQFIITNFSLIFLFTILYWVAGKIDKYTKAPLDPNMGDTGWTGSAEKPRPISLFDSFYFSLVTQTTVGYGILRPPTPLTKIINICQLFTIYLSFIIH